MIMGYAIMKSKMEKLPVVLFWVQALVFTFFCFLIFTLLLSPTDRDPRGITWAGQPPAPTPTPTPKPVDCCCTAANNDFDFDPNAYPDQDDVLNCCWCYNPLNTACCAAGANAQNEWGEIFEEYFDEDMPLHESFATNNCYNDCCDAARHAFSSCWTKNYSS